MPPQRADRALAEVLPLLTNHLSCNEDKHNLRLTCCAVRDAHDTSAKLLTLGSRRIAERALARGQGWRPPSLDEVEATVKAMVGRGGRPSKLELALPAALDAPSRETITLAMVQHLHPTKSITEVGISQCATLTPASAAALCLLEPQLKCLRLTSGLHDDPAPQHSVEVLDTMARSVSLLLQGLGPQLQDLAAIFSGRWRPQLLRPLSRCTALTRLVGAFNFSEPTGGDAEAALEAEVDLMRTISSLTGLRVLMLGGGSVPRQEMQQRAARPAPITSSLSTLTALTSLSLRTFGLVHYLADGGFDLDVRAAELQQQGRVPQADQLYVAAAAEWSALLAAVKDLPSLAVLDTPARVPASDLAALTSLTRLTVGKLVLPRDDGGLGAGWMDYTLPPRLRLLDTIAPLPVRVATRLAPAPLPPPPPESPTGAAAAEEDTTPWLPQPPLVGLRAVDVEGRVGRVPWRLAFEEGDVDEGGALRPEAAAAMRQAVPALLRCFGFAGGSKGKQPERGLCVIAHLRPGSEPVKPPPTLPAAGPGAGGAQVPGAVEAPSHCASWLGSLAAAVRPEVLQLAGLWVSARDMMGLADCMAGLKVLHIERCRYMVSSLPLLAYMPHLAELVVQCGDWDWDCFASDEAGLDGVEAAFLALTANKPECCSAPGEQGAVPGSSGAPTAVPAALPQLRLITVLYRPSDLNDAAAQLGSALARARQELQRRGGGAEVLLVRRTTD